MISKGTYQLNLNLPIIFSFRWSSFWWSVGFQEWTFYFFILFLVKNIWSMNHFFPNEHSGYFWINEIYSSMDFLRKWNFSKWRIRCHVLDCSFQWNLNSKNTSVNELFFRQWTSEFLPTWTKWKFFSYIYWFSDSNSLIFWGVWKIRSDILWTFFELDFLDKNKIIYSLIQSISIHFFLLKKFVFIMFFWMNYSFFSNKKSMFEFLLHGSIWFHLIRNDVFWCIYACFYPISMLGFENQHAFLQTLSVKME